MSRRWRSTARLRELHLLRPDRMAVVPGADGWPAAYDYTAGGAHACASPGAGAVPPILHLTLFHPLDDHYGLAPLEAAATALDIHNAAGALEQGAARQCGAALRRAGLCAEARAAT